MSTTVDQRVVEMQFDNRHFERNVSDTMSTIDKLKQRLNLTGATKGLEEIDSVSKRINFSAMGTAVESVQAKISALQIFTITAFSRMSNAAITTGKNMINALTIDPVKTGFSEYETQINAVQTILANTESKGTTITDVNKALDTLNTYADKTIYNFTEMTRNIGTFTAAGVDLDTSVKSIQGIANLAAVSGSTSQQASTAMYQLSQALAAGKVSLMDWNSVVNAGMGGQVFQDALKRTATAMGTNVDAIIKKYGSFRESLTQGEWLTTEVLTKTLEQFTMAAEEGSDEWNKFKKSLMDEGYTEKQATEILKMANTATDAATKVKTFTQLWDTLKESAQSGWTQTWELIVGDFEEAKSTLTEVSNLIGDVINKSSESRNNLLKGALGKQSRSVNIGDFNNLTKTGISEDALTKSLINVAKTHGVAIDEMIEKEGSFKNTLKNGWLSSDLLKEAMDGISTSMKEMEHTVQKGDTLTKIAKQYGTTVEEIAKLNGIEDINMITTGQVLKLSGTLQEGIELTEEQKKAYDELMGSLEKPSGRELLVESFMNVLKGGIKIMEVVKSAWQEVFPPMTAKQLYSIIEGLHKFTSYLVLSDENAAHVKKALVGVFSVLGIGYDVIKAVVGGIFDLVKNFTGLGGGLLKTAGSFGEWLTKLRSSIQESGVFTSAIGTIVSILSKGITAVKNFGKAIADNFKMPDFSGFLDIMKGLWSVIKFIGSGIVKLLAPVGRAINEIFEGANAFDVLESGLLAGSFIGISQLSGEFDEIWEKLTAVTDAVDGEEGFFGSIKSKITETLDGVQDSLKSWQQNINATILLKIAGAIALLTAALFVLSRIDKPALDQALGAVTLMFIELLSAFSIFSKIDTGGLLGATKSIGIMIAISASMLILATALKSLATLNWDQLSTGILGIGGIMLEMWAFMVLMEKVEFKPSTGVALILLGAALKVFASAVKDFMNIKGDNIGESLKTIGALLFEIWAFAILMNNVKFNASTGVALILLGAALKVFASAVKDFAKMSLEQIGRGLLAMAGALAEIAIAMNLLPKNMVGKGIGLIAVGAALHVLASALDTFQTMSWKEIGRGLTAMGGALAVLGIGLLLMSGTLSGAGALIVATIALAGLTPVLKTLGGMSWSEIGKGLITIAGAIAIIGAAGYLLGPVVPSILGLAGAIAMIGLSVVAVGAGLTLIGVGLTAIGMGITSLGVSLTAAATSIVAGLTVIILGLIDLVPSIISRFSEWIIVLCKVIKECVPEIVDTVLVLVSEILTSLAKYTPQIADALFTFIIGLLDVLADRLPELIQVAVKFIGQFFQGVVDALGGMDTTNLIKGIVGVGLLSGLMLALSAVAGLIPGAMIGVLGMGVVITELAAVLAIIGGLAQIPGLSWLISEGGDFLQLIGTAIGQFVGGIVGGIAQGITSSLPQIGTDLSSFMANVQPFIEGAKLIDSSVVDGVRSLADVILVLTAANIVEGFTSWLTGGSSITAFGEKLSEFAPYIREYADAVEGIDVTTVTGSANAAAALAKMTASIPNEGGVAAWFAGENSITKFGNELVTLGGCLKLYSLVISGFNAEAVIASANAATALADMTSKIPNEGGVAAWFAGENSVAKFSSELLMLAIGLKAYSMAIVGFDEGAVMASINAAKAIADMTSYIPNEGGVAAWFAGENSIASFASQLLPLGLGLSMFSMAAKTINAEAVAAATSAAKSLVDMANVIPNEGGMLAWFSGDNSMAKFASQFGVLGLGLQQFSNAVSDIEPTSVSAAAGAAKDIAEMANIIPNEGGIKSWFSGDNSMANFASQFGPLGDGLKSFSDAVAGISPANITAAAGAATSLASFSLTVPKDSKALKSFGDNISAFGVKLGFYYEKTSTITKDAVTLSTYALNSLKTSTAGFETETIKSAASAVTTMADAIKKLSKVKASDAQGFNSALKNIGVSSVKAIVSTFKDAEPKLLNAGKNLIGKFVDGVGDKADDIKRSGQKSVEKFIDGFESKENTAKKQCKDVINKCVTAISNCVDRFTSAGKSMVQGFAYGISANTYLATAKAREMAKAAEKAAKEELDVNSPSKVFRRIGYSVPEGFAMGIDKMGRAVEVASSGMATAAIDNVKSSISRLADVVNSDIESNPTIRPVVDLSSVKAGANSINSLLGRDFTINTAHVNRINSMMNQRNQNGANDDIISAIDRLRRDLENVGNTSYNLNGLTYNEGSDVAEAFRTIIRAATVERRV